MGPRSNPEEPHNKTVITCGAKTTKIWWKEWKLKRIVEYNVGYLMHLTRQF
jgi:hypothetical protein